jgi:hypothetical protein
MTTPAIYYVNLGFAWFLVLMSIWGYVAIYRNTGQKWSFWLYFGLAWVLLGVSHIFTIGGSSSSEWYMMTLRIVGYALLVVSILSLMVRVVSRESV